MRSICDVLAHVIGVEAFWIQYVIRGQAVRRRKSH
jgi:hypothetical protein